MIDATQFRMSDAKPTKVIAINLHIEREEDRDYYDEETDRYYETIFIEAIAEVMVPFGDHCVIQRIHSGGIGSVIADDTEQIEEYQKEEMDNLKDILKTMRIEVKEESG